MMKMRRLMGEGGSALLALCLILGAFAIAGSHGMTADMPVSRYATETEQIFFALKFGSGDFNPHFFIHPPFFAYILFGVYGAVFVAGMGTGFFKGLADFERLIFTDMTLFYLVARWLALILAVASVVLCWRLSRRLYGRASAALLACGWFCSTTVLVIAAHYGSTDAPMLFLSMTAFTLFSRLLDEDRPWIYGLSGLLIGLASATKYNASFLLVPMSVAHVLGCRARNRPWVETILSRRLALGIALSAVGFFAGCPYALLDAGQFLKDLDWTRWCTYSSDYHFSAFKTQGWGPLYLVATVLPAAMGWPLTLLSLAGLGYALWRRRPADILLSSWILFYTAMIIRAAMMMPRYFIHVIPFLLLLAARLVVEAADRIRPGRDRAVALTVAGLVLAAPSLRAAWRFDALVAARPVTHQAADWIKDNVPVGSRIAAMSGAAVLLTPNEASIDRQLAEAKAKELGAGVRLAKLKGYVKGRPATFDVLSLPFPWRSDFEPFKWDFERLTGQGVRYFVLTDEAREYLADPAMYALHVRFVEAVRRECRMLREFRQETAPLWLRRDQDPIEYAEVYESLGRSRSRPTGRRLGRLSE